MGCEIYERLIATILYGMLLKCYPWLKDDAVKNKQYLN